MNRPARALAVLALALLSPWACSPAPRSNPPEVAAPAVAPPPPAAPARAQAPAAPAKRMTMICRNSQDGRKVECGTPNAVMVGIKEN
jgi:hypothetical protein